MVVFFPEGRDHIPAQARVDGQVAARSPGVLHVEAVVAVAQIEGLTRGLGKVAWRAEQEISVRVAGLCSVDVEGAVESGVGMLIDLVDMELSAELQRVRAKYTGESIAQVISVVDLRQIGDRNTHDEGGKGDVFHAFKLRRLHVDPGHPPPEAKPCDARLTPSPPFGCPMMLALRR